MKRTKFIAIILSMLLLMMPLTACTPGSADPDATGTHVAASSTNATAPTTEPVTDDNSTIDIQPMAFKPVDALSDDVSAALSGFSIDLFQHVAAEDGGKNTFVSPLSVWLALCMTYNGAASTTAEGMAETLHAAGIPLDALNADNTGLMGVLTAADPDVQIAIANSIWMRKGLDGKINEDFLDRNRISYGAKIGTLDFDDAAAADTINGWVEDNTNGNIKQLVEPPISPLTVMFLINAIHFKAPWKVAFDEKLTRDGVFTAADGTQTEAKYLTREEGNVGIIDGDVMAVRLPYASGRLEMVALMPTDDQKLSAFITGLTPEKINSWIIRCEETAMPLLFPKFKVEYELELNNVLKAMGMQEAFSDNADFTAMSENLDLYISRVKHKSFVEVNEQGTEASAATSVEIRLKGMPVSLEFNRPFVYLIRDSKTGAMLFMGIMQKP